jgi:hypothetical protein
MSYQHRSDSRHEDLSKEQIYDRLLRLELPGSIALPSSTPQLPQTKPEHAIVLDRAIVEGSVSRHPLHILVAFFREISHY